MNTEWGKKRYKRYECIVYVLQKSSFSVFNSLASSMTCFFKREYKFRNNISSPYAEALNSNILSTRKPFVDCARQVKAIFKACIVK